MGRVTRKDVAIRSGVSETVVSYVLNRNRYVDEKKRQRVLEAVKELGYEPSPMARALKGKGNGQILLIADDIRSEHFSLLVCELEKRAYREGFSVTLCQWHPEAAFLPHILRGSYSGILVDSISMPHSDVQALIDEHIPTVVMEMKEEEPFNGSYGLINTGLYQGERELLSLLKERGRRHIAFVSFLGHSLLEGDLRYQAYLDEVREPIVIGDAEDDTKLERKVVEAVKEKGVDALACRSDYVACLAATALKREGIDIPADVSLTGFDDTFCGRCLSPRLTTMAIMRDEIALHTLRSITHKEDPLRVQLSCRLVRGESV